MAEISNKCHDKNLIAIIAVLNYVCRNRYISQHTCTVVYVPAKMNADVRMVRNNGSSGSRITHAMCV